MAALGGYDRQPSTLADRHSLPQAGIALAVVGALALAARPLSWSAHGRLPTPRAARRGWGGGHPPTPNGLSLNLVGSSGALGGFSSRHLSPFNQVAASGMNLGSVENA
jgi:hypothetical protein